MLHRDALLRAALGLTLLGAASGPLLAHDFWIEPSTWSAAPGKPLGLQLRVGDSFPGDELARDPEFVRTFVVRDGDELKKLPPLPGRATPAAAYRPTGSGRITVAYESHPRFLELGPKKFRSYLAEEGLTAVIAAREARGESSEPGREHYARCAKTVLEVGDATPWAYEPPVGLTLELELLSDPNGEGPLEVRLLHRGEPAKDVLVTCVPCTPQKSGHAAEHGPEHAHGEAHAGPVGSKGDGEARGPRGPHPARTDKDGLVRFDVEASGGWLLAAVRMEAIDDDAPSSLHGDWLSHWASLRFARR